MRKFKNTLPLGTGLKFFDTYLETELSKEVFDAIQAIINDYNAGDGTQGVILSGGSVTGTAPTAQINESLVALNGKILRLPATTGLSYPFYIKEAATIEINGEFNDLVSRPVIDNEYAETSSSAPGSGQYITIGSAGEYQGKGLIDLWATPSSFDNGWVNYSFQYCKDKNGFVHFRGSLDGTSATGNSPLTLPAGFRPEQQEDTVPIIARNGGSLEIKYGVTVETSGVVRINAYESASGTPDNASLSNISFYAGF